ncbi:S26 family signal peptidase [Streptomyces sp. NPDC003038]|uniref:S26 family signal peptidase n=1 Tax=unclassified Streptomyces TaxID=2593676 RepID=UPI0033A172E7
MTRPGGTRLTAAPAAPVAVAAVAAVAAAASVALTLHRRYVVVTVAGASMNPTLADGDRVLVRRTPLHAIRAGRLVVAVPPQDGRWGGRVRGHRLLIKRAAAVAGDPLPREGAPALAGLPEERVPPGRVVLLGDNPAESLDSRFCGYFRADQIVGAVVRRMPRTTSQPDPEHRDRNAIHRHGKDVPQWRI